MSTGKNVFSGWRGRRRPGAQLLSAVALAFFLIAPLLCAASANAATDISTLVNKLVQKGVISQSDANTILSQPEEGSKAELPAWLKNLSIGGDLRLRYEYLDVQNQPTETIRRARFRYRLQLADQIMKNWKLVFGIASGGSTSPVGGISRSTNQNFGDGFGGKLPRIDLTYVLYTPSKSLAVGVGKFPNPIWTPSMLTWDGNIRPEGVYAVITPYAGPAFDYFLNADLFVLGSPGNRVGPLMGVINPVVDLKFAQKDSIRLAGAYYVFNDLKQNYSGFDQLPANVNGIFHNVTGLNTGDSLDASGNLLYNYNDFWFGTQANFGGLSSVLPYAGLYAEYINNPAPSSDNQGYIMGVKVGHAAINKAGKWQINFNYRRLERNAWLDIFPNADVYFGSTNVMGSRGQFTLGLAKNMQAVVSYYNFKPIENLKPGDTLNHTENTVQVDWLMEF